MINLIRSRVLSWLKMPEEPHAPAGAPGSLKVFRAARAFYWLRLVRWGFTQLAAMSGVIASIVFLHMGAAALELDQPTEVRAVSEPAAEATYRLDEKSRRAVAANKLTLVGIYWLLRMLEAGAIVVFLVQLPFTFFVVKLEYELHWYLVTDRSLRIRQGVWRLQEQTMSFANIQHVTLHQGPLQRLLGLADVKVRSAGGGDDHNPHKHQEPLHTAVFAGIDNATEVRDLILDRLKRFREAGLGDPDEAKSHDEPHVAPVKASGTSADVLAAAHELLVEVKLCRRALS